jgi:hypothetical protein
MPFVGFSGVRLMVNLTAAREQGLTLPTKILKRAVDNSPATKLPWKNTLRTRHQAVPNDTNC